MKDLSFAVIDFAADCAFEYISDDESLAVTMRRCLTPGA
jgi:hypothetical protein